MCHLKNGTTYKFVPTDLLKLDSYDTLENIVERSRQVSYCADQTPGGPRDKNFCFCEFELGEIDGLVVNATKAPTFLPTLSGSKCGGTVGLGDWNTYCKKGLWNPTDDLSMHCFAFGGNGDPCHLNIQNDGVNEGRFKHPSNCNLEIRSDGHYHSYGDVLYLWDDPSLYEFNAQWAANAWVAYSLTRWKDQMVLQLDRGMMVSTPLFTYQTGEQLRQELTTFFSVCGPHCDELGSIAYIDILAVNVFCTPLTENCENKAREATSVLNALSPLFGDRPVHVAQWGVKDSRKASDLLSAMDVTLAFFTSGSVFERIHWYGGDQPDKPNLWLHARNSRLGLIWAKTCRDINKLETDKHGTSILIVATA